MHITLELKDEPNRDIEVLELTTDDQWREALFVLRELRPELNLDTFMKNRINLMKQGYKLFGLIKGDRFLCVAGIALHPHISRDIDFWVHDLVTTAEARSCGLGEVMMKFLEKEALYLGCTRLMVHTRSDRDRAQNFYKNHLNYETYAIVFQKDLC